MESVPELPRECWELVVNSLPHHCYLEPLSLVSTRFLSLTNYLRKSLTISSVYSLPRILRRFPNLKHIKVRIPLEFSAFDLNSILTQIADSPVDLESLDISRQGKFPCAGIIRLGLKMKNLRSLDCSFVHSLEDQYLFVIGSSFPLLEELNIGYPHNTSRFLHVTDAGVVELASKLKKLRKIDVSGNHFISDKSLLALSSNCVLLSELVACDCDLISETGIGLALRSGVGLSSIAVDGIGIPVVDLFLQDSLSYARNLHEIVLLRSFISDEWLCFLAQARLPLRKLSISNCYNFTFDGLYSLLHSYQELFYLNLEGLNFLSDECMIRLSKFLRKLAGIDLNFCCKLTGLTIAALVKNCPLLVEIMMCDTNVGAEDFSTDFVVGNSRVESLKLARNYNLSDECITKIALWCPSLHTLDIRLCPAISEVGVREVLRSCCKIQHLEICQCEGIENLKIDVEVPNLEVLRAGGSMINDEALGMIARRCIGLLHLDLEGCLNVTIEGLNEVAQSCRRLRELNLRYCYNVKPEGIAPMVLSTPSLRKICPPPEFFPTDGQKSLLLRHGCSVCKPQFSYNWGAFSL